MASNRKPVFVKTPKNEKKRARVNTSPGSPENIGKKNNCA